MATRRYEPFEIRAAPSTLAALSSGLSGIALGGRYGTDWLRDADGNVYSIQVSQRDLEFKFEVFSLEIRTMAELAERIEAWVPTEAPTDTPDLILEAMQRRPELPSPPRQFEPWPFSEWRVDVVRRAEFILDDVEVNGAVGEDPILQTAAPPERVPLTANAVCEVAVGLLFSGVDGGRLLIAADWMPFNTLISREPDEISAFLEQCEVVDLAAYAVRVGGRAGGI